MLTPTHLVTAQSAYLAVCAASGNPPAISESLVALAAAMLPDLDSRQSYIGRLVPPLSTWVGTRFGHRTLTHSLAAQVVVLTIAWWLIPTGYFIALAAGWISHSIADMMTRSGVCWFWPSLARCVLPGNPRYRMEVLGQGELWFLLVMVGFGLVMMPLAQRAEGTTGLIRSAIGDIGNARKDFDADKGRLRFTITIRGRDNISYADISGTYRVIGPWREDGFLIATPTGPRSACRGTACDWYADHADLTRAGHQITTSFTLSAEVATGDALRAALAPLTADEIYLIGDFIAPESKAALPTVLISGDQVTLFYATPKMLDAWDKRALIAVELTVQARHAPGVDPGQLGPIGPAAPTIDPRIMRWLE
ncbi:metal-dependent hydrolase [Thiocapsa rosea]|uniref:Inner membrane protein n=1 Tax=Thiocapsa rosea TaxID=69360 RepID=A0A495ULE3_9GAMM|nr:metal-dependent hydrolase [Thiocapsa rosea]RKT37889.1 inner membrane protein [Thiocapsa rosea]